ncbi:MAG: hypothetical protein HFJ51_04795 [Clostridia bacterium]|nr:hypothetical protein [Clostridia bacterium]
MAKYENEGYCPYQWVDQSTDTRLIGLWSLIGPNVVYEEKDEVNCSPDTTTCDQIFSTDPIAYDVLSAIVKRNVNAEKILVHQPHNGACNTQHISDIQKTLCEAMSPQLIVHAGSNFVVIIADAAYGIDVWVWNLNSCF